MGSHTQREAIGPPGRFSVDAHVDIYKSGMYPESITSIPDQKNKNNNKCLYILYINVSTRKFQSQF